MGGVNSEGTDTPSLRSLPKAKAAVITPCLDRGSPWAASTARAPVRAAAPTRLTDAARAATASRSPSLRCATPLRSPRAFLVPSTHTKLALRS